MFEEQLRQSKPSSRSIADVEAAARNDVIEARGALEAAERASREVQDRARRLELDRERTQREMAELEHRAERLAIERAQLADALSTLTRELKPHPRWSTSRSAARAAAGSARHGARAGAQGARG